MIDKMIRIRGIGLLHDAIGKARSLEKAVVMYGENGRGKSTLASIFRSLSSGAPEPILERATLNGTFQPEVTFLIDGKQFSFSNKCWNKNEARILVFDTHFVDTNVHSGGSVGAEHRKNLLEFVLGSSAVENKIKIEELTNRITALNSNVSNANKILKPITAPFNVEDFLSLSPDPDIETKIEDAKNRLRSAERAKEIHDKPRLSEVELPPFKLEVITSLLTTSLASIREEAERRTRAHITSNLRGGEQGEAWIATGLSFLRSNCPFCWQDVTDSSLVEAYRGFFNEAYSEFTKKLVTTRERVLKNWSDTDLGSILNTTIRNQDLYTYWNGHINIPHPVLPSGKVNGAWNDLRAQIVQALDEKIANPTRVIQCPRTLTLASNSYAKAEDLVREYNDKVASVNAAITNLKASTASASPTALATSISRLEAMKRRGEASIRQVCDELKAWISEKEKLSAEKETLRSKVDDEMLATLKECERYINRFLDEIGAGFRIAEAATSYTGGSPRADYKLELAQSRVKVARTGNSPAPAFGNTLSDADKRALAFAFFLARLETDPDLSNRIVVIDDPVSSFDAGRKMFTRQKVVSIKDRCNQLIVLTHDIEFARDLCTDFGCQALHLARMGVYSRLTECDIASMGKSSLAYHLGRLEAFIANGASNPSDLHEIARCIRPMLEGYLHLIFSQHFPSSKQFGEMLGAIRAALPGTPLAALQGAEPDLSKINEYSRRYHHDHNPNYLSEPISETELLGYARRAVAFVQRR